jgi:hypothetical protein
VRHSSSPDRVVEEVLPARTLRSSYVARRVGENRLEFPKVLRGEKAK